MRPLELGRSLLLWYRRNRRSLPWRDSPTPYRVVVSEFMLQQTRVAAVERYFDTFLARFPDFSSLAAAREDEVLVAWSGLGYYRRARQLHALARSVAAAGTLPHGACALRALPGVGAYTAGAVAAIAQGERAAAVDGNVARVLSRLLGVGLQRGRAGERRVLDRTALTLAAGLDPGTMAQALMELGALVCLPRVPRCAVCPWSSACTANATGEAQRFAPTRRSRPSETQSWAAAVVERRGRLLVVVAQPGDLLQGLWGVPMAKIPSGTGARLLVEQRLRKLGVTVGGGEYLGEARHTITFRRMRVLVWRFQVSRVESAEAEKRAKVRAELLGGQTMRWVSRSALKKLPHGSLNRKILEISDGRSKAG